jgi:phosphonatase-like hydrolase
MTTAATENQKIPGVQLVIFDMAGTTVNDDDSVNRCLREALKAEGLEVTPQQVNEVMGIFKPDAIRILIGQSAMTEALAGRVDVIHDDFVARSIRFYREDPSVYEIAGASRTFEILRDAGIKVAINTGFNRPIADVILNRLGWKENPLIAATITSDEVPRGRPHPDMIRALMLKLGIGDPAKVAKVGDTPADLGEGSAAGCGLVVGVTEGTHTRAQLEPHPHTHLIGSIVELPGIFGLR